jgi:hypothetical protein
MDQTADDGLEINTGVLSDNPHAYIVGTDAFFVRFRTSIVDVSGTDDFNMGFRKLEANQANVDDYADMAVFNIESGDIKIETIVGGATTSSTDTTDNWADGEEKFVEVQVDASGTATFLIDGSAPTTTATYQFTSGLTVIPFVYFLQDTDIAGAVPIQIEHGLLT